MNSWVTATKGYKDSDDERECPNCHSLLRVEIVKQDGHNDTEEYYCPYCGHEMKARASQTPTVRLIRAGPAPSVTPDDADGESNS